MFLCEYFILLLQVKGNETIFFYVFAVDPIDTVARTRSYG